MENGQNYMFKSVLKLGGCWFCTKRRVGFQ